MLFADKSSINVTIYAIEATATIIITNKNLKTQINELLGLLHEYNLIIAMLFKVSPVYWIAYVFPRKSNLWVFGGYDSAFEGNAKYLFIYINKSMPNIKAIWVAKDQQIVNLVKRLGFRAYTKHSILAFWYTLRAKVYLYNNTYQAISLWNSSGAIRFNLWHGIPLKKIGHDAKENGQTSFYDGHLNKRVFNLDLYKIDDYVLSTSEFESKYLSSAFMLSKERCLPLGYPKVELFLKPKHEILSFIEAYEPKKTKELVESLNKYDRVLIYMPTWRDDGSDFLKASCIDFPLLNQILKENNFFLLLKLHTHTGLNAKSFNMSNIITLENNADVYPILPFTDILITDYSSVYFDYLLLNKEILFYCFDLDDYQTSNRKMYFDYNSYTPGKKIYSFTELAKTLKDKETIENLDYSTQRKDILDKFWTNSQESSRNIAQFVEVISKWM